MNTIALALLMSPNLSPATLPQTGATMDVAEVAAAAYEAYKQDTLVLLADLPNVPTTKASLKDPEDLSSHLKKQGLIVNRGNGAVIYQDSIPFSKAQTLAPFFLKTARSRGTSRVVQIPGTAITGETITFETKPGEVVDLANMNLKLGEKAILVSPYFGSNGGQHYLAGIKVKNLPLTDFNKMIAKAVGGRVRNTPKEVYVEIDGSLFRTRITKLLDRAYELAGDKSTAKPQNYGQTMEGRRGGRRDMGSMYGQIGQPNIQLAKSTVMALPNQIIESTFAFDGNTASINLGVYTNLQAPVSQFMQIVIAQLNNAQSNNAQSNTGSGVEVQRGGGQAQTTGPQGGNPAENLQRMMSMVNRTNPGKLNLTSGLGLTLELNMGRGNRPGGGNFIYTIL